ncbi:MAG: hypothetical protein JWQ28_1474 [Pedobacter sp.]|nr:hypothetical protein [Pedobacter sp.]
MSHIEQYCVKRGIQTVQKCAKYPQHLLCYILLNGIRSHNCALDRFLYMGIVNNLMQLTLEILNSYNWKHQLQQFKNSLTIFLMESEVSNDNR